MVVVVVAARMEGGEVTEEIREVAVEVHGDEGEVPLGHDQEANTVGEVLLVVQFVLEVLAVQQVQNRLRNDPTVLVILVAVVVQDRDHVRPDVPGHPHSKKTAGVIEIGLYQRSCASDTCYFIFKLSVGHSFPIVADRPRVGLLTNFWKKII